MSTLGRIIALLATLFVSVALVVTPICGMVCANAMEMDMHPVMAGCTNLGSGQHIAAMCAGGHAASAFVAVHAKTGVDLPAMYPLASLVPASARFGAALIASDALTTESPPSTPSPLRI